MSRRCSNLGRALDVWIDWRMSPFGQWLEEHRQPRQSLISKLYDAILDRLTE